MSYHISRLAKLLSNIAADRQGNSPVPAVFMCTGLQNWSGIGGDRRPITSHP